MSISTFKRTYKHRTCCGNCGFPIGFARPWYLSIHVTPKDTLPKRISPEAGEVREDHIPRLSRCLEKTPAADRALRRNWVSDSLLRSIHEEDRGAKHSFQHVARVQKPGHNVKMSPYFSRGPGNPPTTNPVRSTHLLAEPEKKTSLLLDTW